MGNSGEPRCLPFSAAQYGKETDISSESWLDVAWWMCFDIKSFGTAMEPKCESGALFIRKRGVRRVRHKTKRVSCLRLLQRFNYNLN